MSHPEYTLQDVCSEISELTSTLERNNKGDATGWTVADALSNIYYELNRIGDILETMNNK